MISKKYLNGKRIYKTGGLRQGDGLTPKEIADKFALPTEPTHICDVAISPDISLQTGIANAVIGWGRGGGQQFDTIGKRLPQSAYKNERLIIGG